MMTFGFINSSCLIKYGEQAATSSGCGFRFPGGLCLTTLVIKTSSRDNFTDSRIFVRRAPAWPTNGSPVSSSFAPGPSPTQTTRALGSPSPGTPFFAVVKSGHRRHPSTFSAIAFSDPRFEIGPSNSSDPSSTTFPFSASSLPLIALLRSPLRAIVHSPGATSAEWRQAQLPRRHLAARIANPVGWPL